MNTPCVHAVARDTARPRRIRRRLDAESIAEVRRHRDEEGLSPIALALRARVGIGTVAAILHGRFPE